MNKLKEFNAIIKRAWVKYSGTSTQVHQVLSINIKYKYSSSMYLFPQYLSISTTDTSSKSIQIYRPYFYMWEMTLTSSRCSDDGDHVGLNCRIFSLKKLNISFKTRNWLTMMCCYSVEFIPSCQVQQLLTNVYFRMITGA